MSLICPIMINSTTIGAIVIRRMEELSGDEHEYDWELAMKPRTDLRHERPAESYAGTITHRYSDGAVVLLKKVLEQIP